MAKPVAVRVGDPRPISSSRRQPRTESALRLPGQVRGRAVLLPEGQLAGCTLEACAFRDSYDAFREAGAEVIGISSDSADSHGQFAGGSVCRSPGLRLRRRPPARYGVTRTLGLFPGRVTYLIDRDGIVRHIWLTIPAAAARHAATLRNPGESEALNHRSAPRMFNPESYITGNHGIAGMVGY